MAQMKSQSSTIKKQLDQAKEKVASAKPQLDESKKKLDDAKAQIDAMETHLNNGDIYYFIGSMSEEERNKMFESVSLIYVFQYSTSVLFRQDTLSFT